MESGVFLSALAAQRSRIHPEPSAKGGSKMALPGIAHRQRRLSDSDIPCQ